MPTLVGKEVGPIGYGLMGLTWRPNGAAQEEAFKARALKAMKASLSAGANSWNGGELYGTAEYNSLHLLNEYFTKHPEDADKVVLSIKGGYTPGGIPAGGHPDGSEANVKRSIDECLKVLDGKKFLDLFECARIDPNTPVEVTIAAIDKYVQAGKIGGISLSEVSADTIRRAAKVAKISAVEVEFSLWQTDILRNGVAQVCSELNIPIIAYSPMGRGFLTGEIKSPEDIPEGDFRRMIPRFQGDMFYENLKLVKDIQQIASRKGATPGQVALAWIRAQSGKNDLPTIIPIPGASSEERVLENSKLISLTESEHSEIDGILNRFSPQGDRYPAIGMKYAEL